MGSEPASHMSDAPAPIDSRSFLAGAFSDLRDAFGFAFDALRANKVRTALTALGMVIGTASVILVATIALTSRDYVLGQIESVGSNMMYVYHEGGPTVTGTSSVSDAVTV